MSTDRIGGTAYSIQSSGGTPDKKAKKVYGQLAACPVRATYGQQLIRTPLAGIPSDATVTSAKLVLTSGVAVSGTINIRIHAITSAWGSKVTWNNQPTSGATLASVSKTNPAYLATWTFDLTDTVQDMVSGAFQNRGWDVVGGAVSINMRGSAAQNGAPYLEVEWTQLPGEPSNLHPSSGSVSTGSPTLTFDTDDDVTDIQVQVDPDANETSPAYAPDAQAATAGVWKLSEDPNWTELAEGASTQWRARQKNAHGWSDWSDWVAFTRTGWAALTITSPVAAVSDPTPVIEWTYGGTQTSWLARMRDASGAILATSGWTAGTDTSWTPNKGLTTDGQEATVEVFVRDDVDREATPGDPDYIGAALEVTFTLSDTVAAMDTLEVATDGVSPNVILTGTRAAGQPDELKVVRDGVILPDADVTASWDGTTVTLRDPSAPMNLTHVYRLAPVVNGETASGGPTVTVTSRCVGIWLIDRESPVDAVLIAGDDDQDQSQPEASIVHEVLDEAGAKWVRRRQSRLPAQGTIAGTVVDAMGYAAADGEALLRTWADPDQTDAGKEFRLVLGNLNLPVVIGDMTFVEQPLNGKDNGRIFSVSFNWWAS